MTDIRILRELDGWAGEALLIRTEPGMFFVMSTVRVLSDTWETIIFRADRYGRVTDFSGVAEARGSSSEDSRFYALEALEMTLA